MENVFIQDVNQLELAYGAGGVQHAHPAPQIRPGERGSQHRPERQQFCASTPASAPTITGPPRQHPDAVSQFLEQLEGIDALDRAEVEALVRELVGHSPDEQVRRVMGKFNSQQ